ncbi:MAG: sulfate transporter, ATP-binding protein [Geminicoccaceae bacterium]|nr:sulfate transporter, ATP-binding protein [Geminicoccaceae bacterium]
MIRLENLHVRVGAFDLREISLEVPRGGYALIIGPTGSGKTTLLEAVAGHARLLAGRVFMHDDEVTHLPPERRGLGFVYQQYHLFPHLSVRENIGYGLRGSNARPTTPRPETRVTDLADMLAIGPLLDRPVRGLSGGEQQRVALARALAPKPSILLLDEPFAAVDPATRQVLRRELRELHEREGITTLQVTHDFDEALRLGDLVAVLSEGRIAQSGTPEQVFRYPNTAFVARFVGTGNVIAGTVDRIEPSSEPGPFRARFTGGSLTLDVVAEREGPMHAVIRPEDIVLSSTLQAGSARNHIEGRVSRLERMGPVTMVHLDVGRPLIASLTSQSVDEMALRPGTSTVVAFKATAILLV